MEQAARLDAQEAGLDALLAELGISSPEAADERVARLAERQPHYPQYHRIGHKRQAAHRALGEDRRAAERHYQAVLDALLRDDDPSSPRWLVQTLVAAVGRRRVQESLIAAVEQGTPYEQGCAAGAWRWAEAPLRYATEDARRADRPTATSLAERTALADLDTRFRDACRTALADCPDGWTRTRLADHLTARP